MRINYFNLHLFLPYFWRQLILFSIKGSTWLLFPLYLVVELLFKLQVIAEHLSVEEVAGIKEGFQVMDTGNKGKIDINELRAGLIKLGHQMPEADLQILMEAVSVNSRI